MAQDGAGALTILHPVRLITNCPYSTDEQKKRGQEVLDNMFNNVGLMAAVPWEEEMGFLKPSWAESAGVRRSSMLKSEDMLREEMDHLSIRVDRYHNFMVTRRTILVDRGT